MKRGLRERLYRAELLTTKVFEGERPLVWIIDPECTPAPSEGWVRSEADLPPEDGRGRLVIMVGADMSAD